MINRKKKRKLAEVQDLLGAFTGKKPEHKPNHLKKGLIGVSVGSAIVAAFAKKKRSDQ